MLLVKLLGTGALQPLPDRALAAASITCEGRVLLLDCGEGTQAAARRAGVSLLKIDFIALTHYHGDHIFGLPGLLQSMAIAHRTEKVVIFGPKGLEVAMLPIFQLCLGLPFPVELMELPQEGISLGNCLPPWPKEAFLSPFITKHSVVSQGYRFELKRSGIFEPQKAAMLGIPKPLWKVLQHGETIELDGKSILPCQVLGSPRKGISIAYTGDTGAFSSLPGEVEAVDLLICEATYGDSERQEIAAQRGHMCFVQAAQTALEAKVGELWLTHYSPMITDAEEYLSNATDIFANTQCGRDGMEKAFIFEERRVSHDGSGNRSKNSGEGGCSRG